MNVNGITNTMVNAYQANTPIKKTDVASAEKKNNPNPMDNAGAVYEPSEEVITQKYITNVDLVNKLKADAEARTAQLRSLVEKLMSGQGNAIGTADDIWSFLRKGDFTVDAETKAQAQADIAEDGYWGVKQTSDRILDFAKALTGGDPSKIEEMKDAFKKGFEIATETWGGELPEISQKTYEATMDKFDEWAKEFSNDDDLDEEA